MLDEEDDEFDLLGFPLPPGISEEQRKFFLGIIHDSAQFVQMKQAESAWRKIFAAFQEDKLSRDQICAEVLLMRQAVITSGIPKAIRPSAYLLLANLTPEKITERAKEYTILRDRFLALNANNRLRKEIEQVGPLLILCLHREAHSLVGCHAHISWSPMVRSRYHLIGFTTQHFRSICLTSA